MKLLFCLTLLLVIALAGCKKDKPEPSPPLPPPPPAVKFFVKGADISFLPEIEASGTRFYDQNGQVGQLLDILQKNGVNTIRLRLWHSPANSRSGLNEVSAFAKKVKAKGFKLFLTLHYSDTWADPGNQQKPSAWEGLPFNVLGDSVYAYTKRIVQLLDPDIIEVGNEISNGFLWPEGKIENQANFVTLLKNGILGAREASNGKGKILIHCATLSVAEWFYNILKSNDVTYDIIGISYYPFWTKITPADAIIQLDSLSSRFGKEVLIAETAYPFSLGWNDYTNNVLGLQQQLLTGYPATPEGQMQIMTEIRQGIESMDKGIGFCYWEPDWVAFKGPQSTTGSSWENMALFDFNNKALPALSVFNDD